MPQQTARARVALGPFEAEAELSVSAAGILATGALVSAILLSVVPIVRAARARATVPERPQPRRLTAIDQA